MKNSYLLLYFFYIFRQTGPCQNIIQWEAAIVGRAFPPLLPKCSVGGREGPVAAQGPAQSTRYQMGHYQMMVSLALSISQSQEEILTGMQISIFVDFFIVLDDILLVDTNIFIRSGRFFGNMINQSFFEFGHMYSYAGQKCHPY